MTNKQQAQELGLRPEEHAGFLGQFFGGYDPLAEVDGLVDEAHTIVQGRTASKPELKKWTPQDYEDNEQEMIDDIKSELAKTRE